MLLSVVGVIVLWVRAWRSHSKLYLITLDADDKEHGKRLEAVLAQAAYLEYVGMCAALLAVQTALFGFAKLLAK